MVAVSLAIELLLMNCVGMFVRKAGIVKSDFASQLTGLLMKICLPCLIFRSVSQAVEFSLDALKQCGIVILIALITIVLSFLLGQLSYLLSGKSGFGRIMRYGLIFSHFSFMGIPVIQALYGDVGIFYYSFFLIPVRIAYYSLSEPLMTPPGLGKDRKSMSEIVRSSAMNPCLISVALGLVFWVAGWQLPSVIDYCVKSLSGITSPLALLLCGIILSEYDIRKLLHLKYLLLPVARTVIMPLLFILLTLPLHNTSVDDMVWQITVIFTAMPVASLLPVYTLQYDPDTDNQLNAAGACFFSVLMSIITVPIFYSLLTNMI